MRWLLLATLLVPACVKPDPTPRYTPAWERIDTSGPDWIKSGRALLCADCQFHNLYSKALPERNLSAEAAAATAIRPPQLDLFSSNVLSWILETGAEESDVILHLGDAMNLATLGEYKKFLAVMENAKTPWFMAPGNHDSYYFGTYAAQNKELLAAAAYKSGQAVDKPKFIRLYVATILRHDEAGCRGLAAALGMDPKTDASVEEAAPRVPATFEWHAKKDDPGLLRKIAWTIDEEQPWRSFILQSVNLSGSGKSPYHMRVFLLDSCQYSRPPAMTPNAWGSYPIALNCGLTGEMLPDQLRKIREWLEPRSKTVFMCHHPFDTLAPRSRTNLGWLWREYKCGMMVTAHTHAGYYAHHDLGGQRGVVELNIGSTTDWPMEWRFFQAVLNPKKKLFYMRADRRTLVTALRRAGGFFQPGWEVPTTAPDDYRAYKHGKADNELLISYYLGDHYTPYWMARPRARANKKAVATETDVKNTLLWTYHRLVTMFPTDKASTWPKDCKDDTDVLHQIEGAASDKKTLEQKVDLLIQLDAFERGRTTNTDDVRERYKISQAAWASRFMKERGRKLRIEDDLIRADWDEVQAGQQGDG